MTSATAHTATRVLVADDLPINFLPIEACLARLGSEAVFVTNGRQACEQFASVAFDLVLLDYRMPVMDGLCAARWMRQQEQQGLRQRTPIVVLSASAEDRFAARAAGCDEYLEKPLDTGNLLRVLQKLTGLRPAPGIQPPTAVFPHHGIR